MVQYYSGSSDWSQLFVVCVSSVVHNLKVDYKFWTIKDLHITFDTLTPLMDPIMCKQYNLTSFFWTQL